MHVARLLRGMAVLPSKLLGSRFAKFAALRRRDGDIGGVMGGWAGDNIGSFLLTI